MARTFWSTHAPIVALAFASASAAARVGGRADFALTTRTSTVTPMARPSCTAVLIVTFLLDGTWQPARAPRMGPASCASVRCSDWSLRSSSSGVDMACS